MCLVRISLEGEADLAECHWEWAGLARISSGTGGNIWNFFGNVIRIPRIDLGQISSEAGRVGQNWTALVRISLGIHGSGRKSFSGGWHW